MQNTCSRPICSKQRQRQVTATHWTPRAPSEARTWKYPTQGNLGCQRIFRWPQSHCPVSWRPGLPWARVKLLVLAQAHDSAWGRGRASEVTETDCLVLSVICVFTAWFLIKLGTGWLFTVVVTLYPCVLLHPGKLWLGPSGHCVLPQAFRARSGLKDPRWSLQGAPPRHKRLWRNRRALLVTWKTP